jgi:hypothetical protein
MTQIVGAFIGYNFDFGYAFCYRFVQIDLVGAMIDVRYGCERWRNFRTDYLLAMSVARVGDNLRRVYV